MKLYLIRHGQISVTMDVCYGQTDYPPIETITEEAERLKSHIDFKDVKVLTSPLQRCIKLVDKIGIDVYTTDPRLKEINCGDWEGIYWKNLDTDIYKKWKQNMLYEPFPRGESYDDLYKRISGFIAEFVSKNRSKDESFALFTHGGVIRVAIANLLNLKLEDSFKIFMDYGRYAEFDVTKNKIRCNGFNL